MNINNENEVELANISNDKDNKFVNKSIKKKRLSSDSENLLFPLKCYYCYFISC